MRFKETKDADKCILPATQVNISKQAKFKHQSNNALSSYMKTPTSFGKSPGIMARRKHAC